MSSPGLITAKNHSVKKPLFPLLSPLSVTHSLEPGIEHRSISTHLLQGAPSLSKTFTHGTCTVAPLAVPELEHLPRNSSPLSHRGHPAGSWNQHSPLQTHPTLVSSANLMMYLLSPPLHKRCLVLSSLEVPPSQVPQVLLLLWASELLSPWSYETL